MTSMRVSISLPVVILIAVLVGIIGVQTMAMRPLFGPSKPAVIATVDLEAIFEKTNARTAAEAELASLAETLEAEQDAKRRQIEEMDQDVKGFMPGTAQYDDALRKLMRETYGYQALVEYARQKVEVRRAELFQEIYDQIKTSLKTLAMQNGYDIVLLDDSIVKIQPGNSQQIIQQISARRMLYGSPTLDVTNEVIAMMSK